MHGVLQKNYLHLNNSYNEDPDHMSYAAKKEYAENERQWISLQR